MFANKVLNGKKSVNLYVLSVCDFGEGYVNIEQPFKNYFNPQWNPKRKDQKRRLMWWW